MNNSDKIYLNKLSIYDLLVAKNKSKEKNKKDFVKKQLSRKLSDLVYINSNIKQQSNNIVKKKVTRSISPEDQEVVNTTNDYQVPVLETDLNVVLEGKAIREDLIPFDESKNEKNYFLIRKMQKDSDNIVTNFFEESKNKITLALINDLGTTQKYNLYKRKGKLTPISTLKSKPPRILSISFDNNLIKNVSNISKPGLDDKKTINDFVDNDIKDFQYSSEIVNEDIADVQRQRKRSKIRSVEEIISSLKSDDYIQSQLESDKRIDDLIKKVLERTDEENSDEDQEIEIKSDEQINDNFESDDKEIINNNEEEIEIILQDLESNRSKSEMFGGSHYEEESNKNEFNFDNEFQQKDLKTEHLDIDRLLMDLEIDENVTNEDLLGICGSHLQLQGNIKEINKENKDTDFVSFDKNAVHKGIHDLCLMQDYLSSSVSQIKKQFVEKYIPDKFPNHKDVSVDINTDSSSQDRIEKAAERIIEHKNEIEKWRMKALEMLNQSSEMEIVGTYIIPTLPKINDIWQPLYPKLLMSPNKVKNLLCPDYNRNFMESTIEEVSKQNTFENFSTIDLTLTDENSFCNEIDLDALETKERLLTRKINSFECLNDVINDNNNKISNNLHKRKRCSSVPNRHWLEEDSLIVHLEYHQIMEEINIQKQKIRALKTTSDETEAVKIDEDLNNSENLLDKLDNASEIMNTNYENKTLMSIKSLKEEYFSPAEKAQRAGRNYVYYPPKKTKMLKKKQSANISRITAIEKFLERKPNKLEKTISFENILKQLNNENKKKKKKINLNKALSKSLADIQDFESWSNKRGYKKENNTRDWITVVWDEWFDEIYPPIPDNLLEISTDKIMISENRSVKEAVSRELTSLSVNQNEILELPDKIDPVLEEVDKEFREDVIATLQSEIQSISKDLENFEKPNAFLLSRRGAIYRKLGYLTAAFRDINEAINIEPDLITAYWERHLLHLVCNKIQFAIEDLNLIIKKDKNYVAAYKSRAGIYVSTGDLSLAISNLSQAIRLSPDDADAYSKRAELYEQNGDNRLALEDYNQLIRLQPYNCVAMMKHGLYYLNIEQWQLAIKDFSNVLRRYPLNTEAWLYRGTAYTKLCQWQDALTDFSAVIHLDPNNYLAYFKRGCLLRKAEPYLAIRDFSISLLLESSEENIMSYLYRAILYATTKQYSEAIVDFEIVICFNKDMCFAHVDLGLIYFENGDYEKAVKYMTSGLAVEPTYVRAYACRAEAYFKMNKYNEAIKDINRAIHLHPDRSNYYMLRGDFYLALGKMEMAAICVRQAAEISHNLGQSPVQQALVHSFLQHYDQAIDALLTATRAKPSVSLLNLLGTTQMKAQRWKDAITSFSSCLEELKPKSQYKPWPPGAANLYFLVAQCYLELKNYKQSQLAFSATVKINPNHAEAYYHQGWCRLRLGKLKQGILDINKSLAINPKLYQAYLARATLFGFKNQYTKAILNCNEVLVIEPKCLRAYLYRGVLKYKIKAYSLAIKDFTEAIKIDPNCILAYFNRAICFNAEKKNYKKAIQDYSIVLLINNTLQLHYKAYINRGLVYLELGDVSNALHDFIQAQTMQANNIYVLYVVGLCYHKLKNLKEAIRVYSRCLDNDPKFILAKVSRGNVFMDYNSNSGRELAAKDYTSVLEINSDNLDALVNLGFCRQAQGKFKQAWDIFTTAIEKHPNSEKPLDGRAIVCMQMSDLNGALKDLNEAIRIQPQSAVLYTNRGVVYQLMRDGIRAMKDYNKAILIGGYQCQIAYYNVGCVYLHNFQLQQAYDCFMKTVELNPTDEAAWINLGLVLIFQNKLEESLEYINKSISLAPNAAYLFLNRANVLYNLHKYLDAEKDFSKCLTIAPDNPQVHNARGNCRSKMGDASNALEDYKLSVYLSSIKRIRM